MFDKDWQEDFDKEFKRSKRFIERAAILGIVIWIAVLSGIGFVIYKVLLHFGIL